METQNIQFHDGAQADDDFQVNLSSALSNLADIRQNFVPPQRVPNYRQQPRGGTGKRGPRRQVWYNQWYHLPPGCRVPKSNPKEEETQAHEDDGYGFYKKDGRRCKLKIDVRLDAAAFQSFLWNVFPRMENKPFSIHYRDTRRNVHELDPATPARIMDLGFTGILFIKRKVAAGEHPLPRVPAGSIQTLATTAMARDGQGTSSAVMNEAQPTLDRTEAPVEATTASGRRLCPNCHRTRPAAEADCLHCQQERDFQMSLQRDQERETNAREREELEQAQERIRQAEERVQQAEERLRQAEERALLQRVQEERAGNLSAEPDDGFELRFMAENEVFSRRFIADQRIEVLMNFVGSQRSATQSFILFQAGSRTALGSSLRNSTLRDNGITGAAVFHVTWQEEGSEVMDQEAVGAHNEDPQQEENALVDITEDEQIVMSDQNDDMPTVRRPGRAQSRNEMAYPQVPIWIPTRQNSHARPVVEPSNLLVAASMDFTSVDVDVLERAASQFQGPVISGERQSLVDKIETLSKQLIRWSEEDRLTLSVRRSHVLPDALGLLELASAEQLLLPLNLVFIGEPAVDDGGPQREFASLLVIQSADSIYISDGLFTNNLEALDNRDYMHLGRLVALTVLQGGPGLPVFASPVAEYILRGKIRNLKEDDFPIEIKSMVKQLLEMTDFQQLDEVIPDRASLGSSKPNVSLTSDDRDRLLEALYHRHVLGRAHVALTQFTEGLDLGGLLSCLRSQDLQARRLLDRSSVCKLEASHLEDIMDFQIEGEVGSNQRRAEEEAAYTWRYFIRATAAGRATAQLEAGMVTLTLEDVLMWLTGARSLCHLGVGTRINVCFSKTQKLPKVNTCGPVLTIPLVPELKQRSMRSSVAVFTHWIVNSAGFGRV